MQVILTVSGIIGFLVGFVAQQMSLMVACVGVGFLLLPSSPSPPMGSRERWVPGCALSALLVLPPWPFWRRHPLPWRKTASKVRTALAWCSFKAGRRSSQRSGQSCSCGLDKDLRLGFYDPTVRSVT